MAEIKQPTWYSEGLSLKKKGQWLQNWQIATDRDFKDKKLKPSYRRMLKFKQPAKYGTKSNVFAKIINDALAVPGDWALNKADLKYFKKKIELNLNPNKYNMGHPKKKEAKMAKKKSKMSLLYALKYSAKKKGNVKAFRALDAKIKKMEGKR